MHTRTLALAAGLCLAVACTACGTQEPDIVVETLPAAAPSVSSAPSSVVTVTEANETTPQETTANDALYQQMLDNFDFQDCLHMITAPDNPLQLAYGAPYGYAVGEPFQIVTVNNGMGGFDMEVSDTWQFPVLTEENIIAGINAQYSVNSEGNVEWRHFSTDQSLSEGLNAALEEHGLFALFIDGTDQTKAGVVYGITPENEIFVISQNSTELIALLYADDQNTTEDEELAQRIQNVHKLRGEDEPFATLTYAKVSGYHNVISSSILSQLIWQSDTYGEEPEAETIAEETDEESFS